MRKQKYYILNTAISYLSDEQINNLDSEKELTGHGRNSVTTINNEKIFVKKIPLTKLEYDNPFNTSNLYNLPTFYNYGIESIGLNCFRELAMHIKTTNWVLNDDIENFPLLYHYRIIKNVTPFDNFANNDELDKYVKKWNDDKNIKNYAVARNASEYDIVLFLEYFPYILHDWLNPDVKQIESYISQMTKTIDYLNNHNIIHFDANSRNVLSDGEKIYLTDFGLVLDLSFNLTKQEKDLS